MSCLPRPQSFLARLLDRKAFFLACLALLWMFPVDGLSVTFLDRLSEAKRVTERLVDHTPIHTDSLLYNDGEPESFGAR